MSLRRSRIATAKAIAATLERGKKSTKNIEAELPLAGWTIEVLAGGQSFVLKLPSGETVHDLETASKRALGKPVSKGLLMHSATGTTPEDIKKFLDEVSAEVTYK